MCAKKNLGSLDWKLEYGVLITKCPPTIEQHTNSTFLICSDIYRARDADTHMLSS